MKVTPSADLRQPRLQDEVVTVQSVGFISGKNVNCDLVMANTFP